MQLTILARFSEIIAGIREEERVTGGITWRELWLPANRYRLMLAITLQLGAQLTGNTSLAYCKSSPAWPGRLECRRGYIN